MERQLLDSEMVMVMSGTGWIIEQSVEPELDRENRIYTPTDKVYRDVITTLEKDYYVRFEGWVRRAGSALYFRRKNV